MTTKFSFEVPLRHLHEFDEHQDYLFLLSFLLDNKDYLNYAKLHLEKQDKWPVILDNSYNELKVPNTVEEMTRLYNELKPDLVVSPDYDAWTCSEMLEQYTKMCKKVDAQKVLPIARTKEELKALFCTASKALMFAVPYENRLAMSPLTLRSCVTHFLGLNNIFEILTIQPYSCDTGVPIKLAFHNHTIKDWLARGCYHPETTPGYFNAELTKKQIRLAHDNIIELKRLIKEGGV